MCVLIDDICRRLLLELACTRVKRAMFINLCVETIKLNLLLSGTKSDGCGRNASVYQVCTARGITGEGRAEFLKAWGPEAGGNSICARKQ